MSADFLNQIARQSGQPIGLCYHCHTCTAGCPVSIDMEYGPDRIIRLMELGQKERVLTSSDIWLCLTCETCTTRCPNGIDIAGVMDALRHVSFSESAGSKQRSIKSFHWLYVAVIRMLGRTHEATLLGLFKLFNLDILSDLGLAFELVRRGKIPLLPERIKAAGEMKRLYEAAAAVDQLRIVSD